jgi:hypothetical protein
MDFLNKQNITYIIILLFILLSLIHLFNMKDNDIESFITLTEDQNFSPAIKTNIPSTDLVQFNGIGISTEPYNLTTILNSKLEMDSNILKVPGTIQASKITLLGTGSYDHAEWVDGSAKTKPNNGVYNDGTDSLVIGNSTVPIKEGNISISTTSWTGAGKSSPTFSTINTIGRMHLTGTEMIVILNKNGVYISKVWGGNGNLIAEGSINASSIYSSGGIAATNGLSMTGSGNSGIGGVISITNTDKTGPQEAYNWNIYNMRNYGPDYTGGPGKPGSGLSFWRYAKDKPCSGNLCQRHMTLNDDGSTYFGAEVTASANITTNGGALISSWNRPEGGCVVISNPSKTADNNTTNHWVIFNMTGGYGNGLHFWRYNGDGDKFKNVGSQFILYDNGGSLFTGSLGVQGPLSISSRNVHSDNWNGWWQNNGTGNLVIACNTVAAKDGCLKIETSQWSGGPLPTFSTINTLGRLHIVGSENIYIITKGDTVICKNTNLGWNGNLIVQGTFTNSSDRRLKENIKNISENDKDKVLQLVPKTYNMINEKQKRYGLIAQEVEELYPELVSEDDKGMKSLNYIELIPLLLEQIKELKKSIPNPNVLNIGGVTLTANELLKLKQLINQ